MNLWHFSIFVNSVTTSLASYSMRSDDRNQVIHSDLANEVQQQVSDGYQSGSEPDATVEELAAANPHKDLFIDTSQAVADYADPDRALLDRLGKAEAMAAQDKEALQENERALTSLLKQQATLEKKTNSLESRVLRMKISDANERLLSEAGPTKIIPQDIAQVRPERSNNDARSDGMISFTEAAKKAKRFRNKVIGIVCYMIQTFIIGFLYVTFMAGPSDYKVSEQEVRQDEFQWGAFDASECGRDWKICGCAMFCPWVRWSATASHPQISFINFFIGLGIMAFLSSASSITFGATIPLLILIAVLCRQRIRNSYGLPYGKIETFAWDCLLWACCPCCAIAQEARQIEYVESKYEPFYEEMGNPSLDA